MGRRQQQLGDVEPDKNQVNAASRLETFSQTIQVTVKRSSVELVHVSLGLSATPHSLLSVRFGANAGLK